MSPRYSGRVGHREALLAGAKRCLYERGYARTTARDIVAASNANLASIGYHFGSKEALLNAAFIEAFSEWGDELERLFAAEADAEAGPMERFERTWTRVIESFAQHRPLWAASFEIFALAERAPELRAFLAAAQERSRLGLAALLPGLDGAADERLVRAVGSFHHALLAGVAGQWLLDPERAPSGQDLAAALRAIVAGIGPAEPDTTAPPAVSAAEE